MLKVFLILFGCLFIVNVFAQRPDSVLIEQRWHYVYPLPEKLVPQYEFLEVFGLQNASFKRYRLWVQSNDPRISLPYAELKAALQKELVDSLYVSDYNDYSEYYALEHQGPTIPFESMSKRQRKYYERRKQEAIKDSIQHVAYVAKVRQTQRLQIDNERYGPVLPPVVYDLPDGLYVQYYEDFFTMQRVDSAKLLPKVVARKFELKNNVYNGAYQQFSYFNELLSQGFYEDGIRDSTWTLFQLQTKYQFDYFDERSIEKNEISTTPVLQLTYSNGLLNGPFYRKQNGGTAVSGFYTKGYRTGIWKDENQYDEYAVNNPLDSIHWQPVMHDFWRYQYNAFMHLVPEKRPRIIFSSPYFQDSIVPLGVYNTSSWFGGKTETRAQGAIGYKQRYCRFIDGVQTYTYTKKNEPRINERLQYRTDLSCVVGARFYPNGKLLDTLSFDIATNNFIYSVFSAKGTLLMTKRFSKTGTLVDTYFRYPEPWAKTTQIVIEGRPVSMNRATNQWKYYNSKDTIEGTILYREITWDESKKHKISEIYDDTLTKQHIEKHYNAYGEVAYESIDLLAPDYFVYWKKVRSADFQSLPIKEKEAIMGYFNTSDHFKEELVQIDFKWGDFLFHLERDTVLKKNETRLRYLGENYSGKAVFRFDPALTMKKGKNEIILGAPRLPASDLWESENTSKERKQLMYTIPSDQNNPWYVVTRSLFGGYLFYNDIVRAEGMMENGKPVGTWRYFLKDNTQLFQLEYQNGLPSGTIRVLNIRSKEEVERAKQFFKDGKLDVSQKKNSQRYLPKSTSVPEGCDTILQFTEYEYAIKAAKFDGWAVQYDCYGDTIGAIHYENGKANGKIMTKLFPESDADEYFLYRGTAKNGKLDGKMLVYQGGKRWVPIEAVDSWNSGVLPINSRGKYQPYDSTDVLLSYCDTMALYQYSSGLLDGAFFLKSNGDKLTGNFLNGKEHGQWNMVYEGEKEYTANYENGYLVRFSTYLNAIENNRYTYPLYDSMKFDNLPVNFNTSWIRLDNFQLTPASLQPKLQNDYKVGLERKAIFSKLYTNGQLTRQGNLADKKNIGLWKYYTYSGRLTHEIDFYEKTRKDTVQNIPLLVYGKYFEYDSLGNLISERLLIENSENYMCSSDDYYATRQYVVTKDVKDNVSRSNGQTIWLFDNGTIMCEGNLINGIPDGLWKFYTPDGKLTQIGRYKMGKRDGRWLNGDLSNKAYIGDLCMDEDAPGFDFKIAQLQREIEITVILYKNGKVLETKLYEKNE